MIITRTPFRISFFGGGTDIPEFYLKHGGQVLSTTIDKYLYITCRHMPPFWEHKHRFVYGSKTELVSSLDEIDHPSIRETLRYLDVDYGIDMHYNTDIPARSGIGSSSSFTVGLVHSINGLSGKLKSKSELMYDSIHIERELIGEAVGSQDQAAAAYGGFNRILFRRDGKIEVRPVTLPARRINELERHLFLVFTGFQRYAKDIEIEKIRRIEKNTQNLIEMKSYVDQALDILNHNEDILQFGELLNDTWKMKRGLSVAVSNSDIDEIYDLGLKNGAIGGKLLGAGGGGFMLFFVRPQEKKRFMQAMQKYVIVPFSFENSGSQVIYYMSGKEDTLQY